MRVEWYAEPSGSERANLHGVMMLRVDKIGPCWVATARMFEWNGSRDGRRDDDRRRTLPNAKRRALQLGYELAAHQRTLLGWAMRSINADLDAAARAGAGEPPATGDAR